MTQWSDIRHFTPDEFACKCCGANEIQPGLIYKLDFIREEFGKPLVVTSGYRCPEHNQRVSTTGVSGPHTTGLAADLGVSGRDAVTVLRIAMAAGFTGIGIQQKGVGRFIHLDLIPDSHSHKRPWIWSY